MTDDIEMRMVRFRRASDGTVHPVSGGAWSHICPVNITTGQQLEPDVAAGGWRVTTQPLCPPERVLLWARRQVEAEQRRAEQRARNRHGLFVTPEAE